MFVSYVRIESHIFVSIYTYVWIYVYIYIYHVSIQRNDCDLCCQIYVIPTGNITFIDREPLEAPRPNQVPEVRARAD